MYGLLIYKSTKTENYGICRLGLYGTIILGIGIIANTVVQNLVYFDMELYQKAVVIYNWGIVAAVCTVGWILLAVGTRTSLGMKIFLMARYPLFYLCTWLVGTHINYEDPISGNMVYTDKKVEESQRTAADSLTGHGYVGIYGPGISRRIGIGECSW